jgi:small-conductance mechanosensitive channel
VRTIAVEAARRAGRVLAAPQPVCHVTGFGDSAVNLVLRFWIDDPVDGLTNIKGEVMLALWDAFREHGIELPYPQREPASARPAGGAGRRSEAAAGRRMTAAG